jgi:hypothetical protein
VLEEVPPPDELAALEVPELVEPAGVPDELEAVDALELEAVDALELEAVDALLEAPAGAPLEEPDAVVDATPLEVPGEPLAPAEVLLECEPLLEALVPADEPAVTPVEVELLPFDPEHPRLPSSATTPMVNNRMANPSV